MDLLIVGDPLSLRKFFEVKIKDLEFGDYPLMLAPMEDVTDHSFRTLCKDFGVDLMYTEFVSSDALIRNIQSSLRKLTILAEERPVGIQIYGNDVDTMVEAALIAQEAKPELIDINFGCPVKKIAKKGCGSGMLRNTPLLVQITEAIVKAVHLPVTVKTRLGWDEKSLVIENLAEQLQDIGVSALTVHGRTRAQMYTGEADWTLIGRIKENQRMQIPIIGNGDVTTPQKAKLYFDRYGVDGIMVGRGAIGRPWIFQEMKHYLRTGEELAPPSMDEHTKRMKTLVQQSVETIGERGGILHARRHLAVSFKNLPDFRPLRIKLLRENTLEGVCATLDEIAVKYADYNVPVSE